MMKLLIFILFSFFISSYSHGKEVIRFSEKELEKETVFPVFDLKDVLKNRLIKTKNRIEVGLGMGWNTTEALYSGVNYNANLSYHLTEAHAVNVFGSIIKDGFSNVGKKLLTGEETGIPVQFVRVPYSKAMIWGNYQFTAYYGKISLSKFLVTNTSLYSLLGAGGFFLNDDSFSFGLNVGVGQKIYLSRRFSLRFDLRLFGYRRPDITDDPSEADSESESENNAVIPNKHYKQVLSYDICLTVNLAFLI